MDENTNTTLFIIAGVCILAIIVIAFTTKLPDLIGAANNNVIDTYQTQ